ncbi:Uncharacterized protein PHSC3_001771 [Chlamydiales bacterium STE3]|nr:Uncharacterized protein PHSC3_001771 [Chlamydiales bacterium STE3]
MFWLIHLSLCCFFFCFAHAEESIPPATDSFKVTVDLRNPLFEDQVLSTTEGGLITAPPSLRIQARNIQYIRKEEDGVLNHSIEASQDLIVEFGEYVFVGASLSYDFTTQTGVLYNARTSVEPWFFGGKKILLHKDDSFTIYDGFITTSESTCVEWEISADEANLCNQQLLSARNVQFRVLQMPLFWLPSFKLNLNSIFDSPVRYSFKWGGKQGSRASMIYEIFSWERFKAFARIDYRLKRGWGAGLETEYHSRDEREVFQTINYWAKDNSVINKHEKHRYRFQGIYSNRYWDDSVSLDLTWDKLSDKDMSTDYNDRGLELDTAGRTQLLLRKQNDYFISHFLTKVRVNRFQTVNQELPTFDTSLKPYVIGPTGVIGQTFFSGSFLDFTYANNLRNVEDYHSPRIEINQDFFRPFSLSPFQVTPGAGFVGIFYGNPREGNERWLALGKFQIEANAYIHRFYNHCKHVIKPYLRYEYITYPTINPDDHYIFNIEDGWYRLDMMRVGTVQELYFRGYKGLLSRPLRAEFYTNIFFDTKTIQTAIPRVYADVNYQSLPTLAHSIQTGWDCQHNLLDHFNFRTEWTVSDTFAIAGEYRHRSSYAWRKADKTNFILESFRKSSALLQSPLSDRRDTLLMHLFYQIHPNWAVELEMRHGWNRRYEKSYTEFEIDFLGTLRSSWNVKASYQHKEEDDRIAFYFFVGMKRPDRKKYSSYVPCTRL